MNLQYLKNVHSHSSVFNDIIIKDHKQFINQNENNVMHAIYQSFIDL